VQKNNKVNKKSTLSAVEH